MAHTILNKEAISLSAINDLKSRSVHTFQTGAYAGRKQKHDMLVTFMANAKTPPQKEAPASPRKTHTIENTAILFILMG